MFAHHTVCNLGAKYTQLKNHRSQGTYETSIPRGNLSCIMGREWNKTWHWKEGKAHQQWAGLIYEALFNALFHHPLWFILSVNLVAICGGGGRVVRFAMFAFYVLSNLVDTSSQCVELNRLIGRDNSGQFPMSLVSSLNTEDSLPFLSISMPNREANICLHWTI